MKEISGRDESGRSWGKVDGSMLQKWTVYESRRSKKWKSMIQKNESGRSARIKLEGKDNSNIWSVFYHKHPKINLVVLVMCLTVYLSATKYRQEQRWRIVHQKLYENAKALN